MNDFILLQNDFTLEELEQMMQCFNSITEEELKEIEEELKEIWLKTIGEKK